MLSGNLTGLICDGPAHKIALRQRGPHTSLCIQRSARLHFRLQSATAPKTRSQSTSPMGGFTVYTRDKGDLQRCPCGSGPGMTLDMSFLSSCSSAFMFGLQTITSYDRDRCNNVTNRDCAGHCVHTQSLQDVLFQMASLGLNGLLT